MAGIFWKSKVFRSDNGGQNTKEHKAHCMLRSTASYWPLIYFRNMAPSGTSITDRTGTCARTAEDRGQISPGSKVLYSIKKRDGGKQIQIISQLSST